LVDFSEVALPDFEAAALSLPAAVAGDGPAIDTKSPAANIRAPAALALTVMWNLPFARRPNGRRDCAACPQRGRKRESSGNTGQKQGSVAVSTDCLRLFLRDAEFLGWGAVGARQVNQCYEPAVWGSGRLDSRLNPPIWCVGLLITTS